MKWLGQILTSLLLVAAGALVLAMVQDPISQYFSGDRIDAEVELAQWQVRPSKEGLLPATVDDANALRETVGGIAAQTPKFARMVITNPGQKTATAVRVRFEGYYSPDILVSTDDGQKEVYTKRVKDIRIKDLAPGEMVVLNMWEDSGFSPLLFPDSVKTYSSLGAFRIEFKHPESKYWFEDEGVIEWFLDEWLGAILIGLLILTLIVTGIGMAAYHSYFTALLKDDSFYLDEKVRFEQNPKKFEPKSPSQ